MYTKQFSKTLGTTPNRNSRLKKFEKGIDLSNRCDTIVNFWFSYQDKDGVTKKIDLDNQMPRDWFNSRYKELINVEQFAQDLENVQLGQYNQWQHTKEGKIALVVLCN